MDEASFIPELCPAGVGEPMEEDVETTCPEASGMDSFCSEDDLGWHMPSLDARIAPFICSSRVIISMACTGGRDLLCISFSYAYSLLGLFCRTDNRYRSHGKLCRTCYNYRTYI